MVERKTGVPNHQLHLILSYSNNFCVFLKSSCCCLALKVLFDVCMLNVSQICFLTEIKGHRLLMSVALGGNLLISVTCVRYCFSNYLLIEMI